MALPNGDSGFGIVNRPQSPTADLIFIHGLNGHPHVTWTNRFGEFWLPWLQRDFPHVRVWTYGYNAGTSLSSRDALDFHATQFLSELSRCLSVRMLF
jgi:hypothetical protein